MPYSFNFDKRIWWLTRSKAFLKSTSTIPTSSSILGWSIIYRERGHSLIFPNKVAFLSLRIPFCHTCSKQCRPWWNASFRLGLPCLRDGIHLCLTSINGSSIIYRKKLSSCSYDNGAHLSLKSVFLSIMRGVAHMRRSKRSLILWDKDYKFISWVTWPFWFYHSQSLNAFSK